MMDQGESLGAMDGASVACTRVQASNKGKFVVNKVTRNVYSVYGRI